MLRQFIMNRAWHAMLDIPTQISTLMLSNVWHVVDRLGALGAADSWLLMPLGSQLSQFNMAYSMVVENMIGSPKVRKPAKRLNGSSD